MAIRVEHLSRRYQTLRDSPAAGFKELARRGLADSASMVIGLHPVNELRVPAVGNASVLRAVVRERVPGEEQHDGKAGSDHH